MEIWKKILVAGVVLAFLYGTIQVVVMIGPMYVLGFLYLLLGGMVAWETKESQGHRLWFLVVPFWLPLLFFGVVRKVYFRGENLLEGVKEDVAREMVEKEDR